MSSSGNANRAADHQGLSSHAAGHQQGRSAGTSGLEADLSESAGRPPGLSGHAADHLYGRIADTADHLHGRIADAADHVADLSVGIHPADQGLAHLYPIIDPEVPRLTFKSTFFDIEINVDIELHDQQLW